MNVPKVDSGSAFDRMATVQMGCQILFDIEKVLVRYSFHL